jgi:hypothetical protein
MSDELLDRAREWVASDDSRYSHAKAHGNAGRLVKDLLARIAELEAQRPAPSVPDELAKKVAIAEWVAQHSWWTYSAAREAVAKAKRLAAAPEVNP